MKNALKYANEIGLISHDKHGKGKRNISFNNDNILSTLKECDHVPVPKATYLDFIKNNKQKDGTILHLSLLVAYCSLEYELTGKQLEMVTGNAPISEEAIFMRAAFIEQYFDIDNPTLDTKEPFYWFNIKNEVYELFKEKG